MSGSVSMVDGHIDPETRRMTDKEIIKALECCKGGFCCGCPRISNNMGTVACMRELTNQTLDLINRQQAEKKELKTENLILSQKRFNIFEKIEFTDKLKKQAKAEAIKEFAERLKEKLVEESYDDWQFFKVVGESEIDDLVKEKTS